MLSIMHENSTYSMKRNRESTLVYLEDTLKCKDHPTHFVPLATDLMMFHMQKLLSECWLDELLEVKFKIMVYRNCAPSLSK
jgi:hypothetical protein